MKKLFLLLFSLFFAALIIIPRFYHLSSQPPGLHIDEVSFAADAKAIAETGRDTWNESWPLIFRAFGEWKAPGLVYSMAFWARLLGGMDSFVARLPSAIAGLVMLVALFLTLYELISKKSLGVILFSVFILAFSPWHFDMSRIFYEAFSALSFVSLSILFITKATLSDTKKLKYLLIAAVFAALAGYWYASIRYVVILMIIVAIMIQEWSLKEKLNYGLIVLLVFFSIGLGWVGDLASDKGLNRFNYYQSKTANDIGLSVNNKRQYCYLSNAQNTILSNFCYLIWNKPVESFTNIVKVYYSYLGTDYLFLSASSDYGFDSQYGAFLLPVLIPFFVGLFYLVSGLINYLGFVFAKKSINLSRDQRIFAFMAITIIISLIPATVSSEVNMRMSFVSLYISTISIAFGLEKIWIYLSENFSKVIKILVSVIFIFVYIFYAAQSLAHYFIVFTHSNDLQWTSDVVNVYSYIKSNSQSYDRIIDTSLHGPISGYFYGDLTTSQIQEGSHSEPDSLGFTQLIKAGKYELRHVGIKDLACEKWGNSNLQKILVIAQKSDGLDGVNRYTTFTWDKVDIMHEVYDLDDVVKYQLDHDSSFKNTCTAK